MVEGNHALLGESHVGWEDHNQDRAREQHGFGIREVDQEATEESPRVGSFGGFDPVLRVSPGLDCNPDQIASPGDLETHVGPGKQGEQRIEPQQCGEGPSGRREPEAAAGEEPGAPASTQGGAHQE